MSTVEVDVVCVRVTVGQHVAPDDVVAEVQSEKADFSVTADASGVVAEILVVDGQVCAVGDVLLTIAED